MRFKIVLSLAAAIGAIVSQNAVAADLPARMPTKAPAAVVAQTWSGIYVGGTVGYVWGRANNSVADPGATQGQQLTTTRVSGIIAGGTLGANWQTGNVVLGIEGDGSWTDADGGAPLFPQFNAATTLDVEQRWLATARARLGLAHDRWLVYVTGGAAWTSVRQSLINPAFATTTDRQTLSGWTAGGGVEAMLGGNWSAKVEYLYVDFNEKDFFTPFASGGPGVDRLDLRNHIVRAGLNYRFAPLR